MNYDDLLWKCKDALTIRDYNRLCGLVVREKELNQKLERLNEIMYSPSKYSDIISDGGMDPR